MGAGGVKVLFVQYLHEPVSADVVVALTPTAFQQCLDVGLFPSTPDDHIRRPLVDETAYLSWQLRFFERLVGFDGADWESRRLSAHLIRTPIDSLVACTRLLGLTLDVLRPTAVRLQAATFVPPVPAAERPHLQFWPLLGDRPLVALVLPQLCAQRGIAVEVDERPQPRSFGGTPSARVRAKAAAMRQAQLLYNFSHPAVRLRRVAVGSSDLICSSGYGMRVVAADALRDGRRVLLAGEHADRIRIVRTGTAWSRALLDEPLRPLPRPQANVGPLLEDIDEWCGSSVGEVLRSRLTRYLYDTCGRIEAAARILRPLFEKERVRNVWTANPHRVVDFAALQAAGQIGATRTLVQHGDQLFRLRYFMVTETPMVDRMVVSDATVPGHLTEAARTLAVRPPSFLCDSPRLAQFNSRHPIRPRDWDALPVCYLPAMFVGDSHVIEAGYFEDTEYFRWQLRLLETFASHRRSFVWKALPQSNQARDPIPRQIARRGVKNVTYVTKPFTSVIDTVGLVLTDFPSTGAFETVFAGHPLLALLHERFATGRSEAVRAFGRSAVVVDSWEKARDVIEAFLSGRAETFIVDVSKIDPRLQGTIGCR